MSGLYGKYTVGKADGSPTDPDAQYFVLRLDTDPAARTAIRAYAGCCPNTELARDLFKWVNEVELNLTVEALIQQVEETVEDLRNCGWQQADFARELVKLLSPEENK